jgi:ubiquinone/menaquinone biosynthesis C-methylase UbiE
LVRYRSYRVIGCGRDGEIGGALASPNAMIKAVSGSDFHPIFDEFAEEYERHAAESAYNALYDRPAVLELLGEVAGQRVLDAGCGPGLYAEELVARGGEVVAFDHSPRMVDLARNRLGDKAMVRVHDLVDPLDWLEDDSFHGVVLALVIHHLDDRVAALRELRRVLRPGGRLVVSTHHPTADWRRQGGSYFTIEAIGETWNQGWSVRYWRLPLTATCAELTKAGFLIERLVEPQPAPGMAERFPEDHKKLNREPGFINFRLEALVTSGPHAQSRSVAAGLGGRSDTLPDDDRRSSSFAARNARGGGS